MPLPFDETLLTATGMRVRVARETQAQPTTLAVDDGLTVTEVELSENDRLRVIGMLEDATS